MHPTLTLLAIPFFLRDLLGPCDQPARFPTRLDSGTIDVYSYRSPSRAPLFSHNLSVRAALKSTARYLSPGAVRALACTSDGHALAVGWDSGWALWSTYGKLMACSLREDWESASKSFSDSFMFGISEMVCQPKSQKAKTSHIDIDISSTS